MVKEKNECPSCKKRFLNENISFCTVIMCLKVIYNKRINIHLCMYIKRGLMAPNCTKPTDESE